MISRLLKSFSKSTDCNLPFSTDLHSHLIPSIDDGSKSLEETLHLIRQYQEIGIKKLITTPHIMSHRYFNTKKDIQEAYNQLQKLLQQHDIDINLEVAAEYYYDEHFFDLIQKDELLSFSDDYVLFELSYYTSPIGLETIVHQLIDKGYKPILAHPERYRFYSTKEHYHRLKDMGLLLQINAISYEGFYGKHVKKSVELILKEGLVDFVGSDVHSQKYIESYTNIITNKNFQKLLKINPIKNDYL